MQIAVSTHWNAHRHASGDALVEEILALGADGVELGYDLTVDLVPGVLDRVQRGAVTVTGVHNYCPVPIGAMRGNPELYVLASADPRVRERAYTHTQRSVEFCSSVGGTYVVVHAGMVDMPIYTKKLIDLAESGKQAGRRYEKTKLKLHMKREKRAARHVEYLIKGVEQLMPVLESSGVALAIEILPYWESVPTEPEILRVLEHFDSPLVRMWYDTGHGRIRENLGMISSFTWLRRMRKFLAGMHVHDVIPPARDHVMPPRGGANFDWFSDVWRPGLPTVLEPAPGTPSEHVREGIAYMRHLTGADSTAQSDATILAIDRESGK